MTSPRLILTHENPDLDNTLSVWLLKRFGEQKYPGISKAPVQFSPAGVLPDDMHPEDLEQQQGILAVDTGGGRLDTHSRDGVIDRDKQNKSAALLVAEDLAIADKPELEKLLKFVTAQEVSGRSIASSHPMDHLVSLPNLLRGLNIRYQSDPEHIMALMMEMYDAALTTEEEWTRAVEDYKSAKTTRLGNKAKLVSIFSDSAAALKVARLHKADLIIHRNSAGHTGITARSNGVLSDLNLEVVAEVVRVAESIRQESVPLIDTVRSVGMIDGWFLHDSGRILSKGSPKNREVPPSRLSLDELHGLAKARMDPSYPMPQAFCAIERAGVSACSECLFEPLNLETCEGARVSAGGRNSSDAS